jgi:hypothetical protein
MAKKGAGATDKKAGSKPSKGKSDGDTEDKGKVCTAVHRCSSISLVPHAATRLISPETRVARED